MRKYLLIIGIVAALIVLMSACGGADVWDDASDTGEETDAEPTELPEPWRFDLEWPETIPLEESDVIRLILIPAANGTAIVTEFANHETVQQDVEIRLPQDYIVNAVANLQGDGFVISPQGEQSRELQPGERITWHWTVTPSEAGQQSLSVSVVFQWRLIEEEQADLRTFSAFSKGMQVDVTSVFGMSNSKANQIGMMLAVFLVGMIIYGGARIYQYSSTRFPSITSNQKLLTKIQPTDEIMLSDEERAIIKSLFRKYEKVVISNEFFSGYSGARTFMALPTKADGRRDAHTIIKINDRSSIQTEFENFEKYVKHSLPPITGRIQQSPVIFRDAELAGLRYTFIGESQASPKSLRQALLQDPDPKILDTFFNTFGPHWWQQNKPITFRLAQEYDRKLPAHYVVTPSDVNGKVLDGMLSASECGLEIGEDVTLKNFPLANMHLGSDHQTLTGIETDGLPALRINWQDNVVRKKFQGKIIATRESFLRQATNGFDLNGMSDPIDSLEERLSESVEGSRSIIHGDLNLENILVGPGNLLWLIDFAETREGHTLYDFAHLAAEVCAHILSAQYTKVNEYAVALKNNDIGLLNRIEQEALKYLYKPADKREYYLALYISCLGAQKYKNLSEHAKHLLFLTAAYVSTKLQ